MEFTIIDNIGFCRSAARMPAGKSIRLYIPEKNGELHLVGEKIHYTATVCKGECTIPKGILLESGIYHLTLNVNGMRCDLGALKSSGGFVWPTRDGLVNAVDKIYQLLLAKEEQLVALEKKVEDLTGRVTGYQFF